MAESNRLNSPLSSSPARAPSFSRPHWPWSTYTHRTLSSQSSLHSLGGNTPGAASSLSSSWDRSPGVLSGSVTLPISSSNQTPMRQNTGSSIVCANPPETTRHWTFSAFEWVVRDVAKLRDFVESRDVELEEGSERPVLGPDDFEILKESPMLGDGKFKLEIARAPLSESNLDQQLATQPEDQHLSLYITSLLLDFAHTGYKTSATMMAAIKCQDDRVGERGARSDWAWEFWQHDWIFRQGNEVWECPLPRLSKLLEHQRIRETDSFIICIQIHCPIGPFFPSQPSAYYVPRDLLDGLEASLDNSNTGDVRFICLERQTHRDAQPQPSPRTPSEAANMRPSSSSSSHSPLVSQRTARKRIIYAHSDILISRSEYFANMFSSAFLENAPGLPTERKVYTVICEEADFETMYWLLKWIYANWLLFKEYDDPRDAVDGVGAGWSANWLNSHGGEWDWKTFRRSDSEEGSVTRDDTRSAASGESLQSKGDGSVSSGKGARNTASSTKGTTATASSPRSATSATARRSVASSISGVSTAAVAINDASPSDSRSKSTLMPLSTANANYSTSIHYHSQRSHAHQSGIIVTPDPHPHPTPTPPPASALSMYQVAHRYALPGLCSLALEHMISTLTPQSSLSLLLAVSTWETLRSLIEDYVIDNWAEVSVSEEFEQCCQEIAAGEWGVQGGKTLTGLFRRLRSPASTVYSRT